MISKTKSWQQLTLLQQQLQDTSLTSLFEQDKQRATNYSLQAANLFLDYSKNLINDDVMQQLLLLTEEVKLSQRLA